MVGAAFLTVKLLAIILDPLLGGLMDRTRSSLGRFRPWMLAAVRLLMPQVATEEVLPALSSRPPCCP